MTVAIGERSKVAKPRRRERAILFSVGSSVFAIEAGVVQEICSTDGLAGSASDLNLPALPKVKHMLRRRNRTYYVVNACAHFRMKPSRPALVLILRNSRAAVLVDAVERMIEFPSLQALPRAFCGEERIWYRGLALLDDQVVPLVNPAAFLSDAELEIVVAARPAASRAAALDDRGVLRT